MYTFWSKYSWVLELAQLHFWEQVCFALPDSAAFLQDKKA